MTKNVAITLYRIIAGIPVNKFDKEARAALLNNFDALLVVAEAFDKKLENYNKKLYEGREADRDEVKSLREKARACAKSNPEQYLHYENLINTNYTSILELEKTADAFIEKTLAEDVKVTLTKLSREAFIEGCINADYTITPVMLKELKPMFK